MEREEERRGGVEGQGRNAGQQQNPLSFLLPPSLASQTGVANRHSTSPSASQATAAVLLRLTVPHQRARREGVLPPAPVSFCRPKEGSRTPIITVFYIFVTRVRIARVL